MGMGDAGNVYIDGYGIYIDGYGGCWECIYRWIWDIYIWLWGDAGNVVLCLESYENEFIHNRSTLFSTSTGGRQCSTSRTFGRGRGGETCSYGHDEFYDYRSYHHHSPEYQTHPRTRLRQTWCRPVLWQHTP